MIFLKLCLMRLTASVSAIMHEITSVKVCIASISTYEKSSGSQPGCSLARVTASGSGGCVYKACIFWFSEIVVSSTRRYNRTLIEDIPRINTGTNIQHIQRCIFVQLIHVFHVQVTPRKCCIALVHMTDTVMVWLIKP